MVMGGGKMSCANRKSLERLKALDSLPDLATQLEEARRLCTHSARAEMIAKWLFGKLQTDPDVQQEREAWDAFISTLRLLPSDRTAALLGASKILKTIQDALAGSTPTEDLLRSATDILRFLLELASAPNGVALRAGLCLPAEVAAQFVGVWLAGCLANANTHDEMTDGGLVHEINAGLDIWSLRKGSGDENEAFSKHCLVPCAAILSMLGPYDAEPTKRKRPGKVISRSGTHGAIEALLAKHIFLPGRTAFFKTSGSNAKQVGSQRPSFVIDDLTAPLRNIAAADGGSKEATLVSLPQLLDIALRSSPNPTPRQRAQEQPWIETLFKALYEVSGSSSQQPFGDHSLSGMLTVLANRSRTLSGGILTDLLKKHTGLASDSVQSIDWKLVSAIASVDATLFMDLEMARLLFDALTRSCVKLGEDAVAREPDRGLDQAEESMRSLWKAEVVGPVLKAFADRRKLPDFIELWSEQLESDLHGTFWSVWMHLDDRIQELLESTLTEDHVLSACLERCQTVVSTLEDESTTDDIPELSAAIVVLNALLGGIRNESTLERLHPHLQPLFVALMSLHDVHVGPGLIPILQERRCWALMTTVFELWYPRWVVNGIDAAATVSQIESLVSRSVLDRAAGLSSTVSPENHGSAVDARSASDAKCFVLCVCTKMLSHRGTVGEESVRSFHDILHSLIDDESDDRLSSDAFVLYPEAISFMEGVKRKSLLRGYMRRATGKAQSSVANLEVIKAIAASAVARSQSPVIDDIANTCLNYLTDESTESEASTLLAIEILSELPARSLTRPRRERILDTLAELRLANHRVSKPCLALALQLMEQSNPTARISVEPSLPARIAGDLDTVEEIEQDNVTIAFYHTLVSLVIQQCSRTKDQERSKSMLIGLSSEAKKVIKASTASTSHDMPAAQSALVKTVFRDLETGALDSLKPHFPHRKPSVLNRLLKTLAGRIEGGLKVSDESVLSALDILHCLPVSLVASSGFNTAPVLASLASFLDTNLPREQAERSQDLKDMGPRPSAAVMVRCYETLGALAPSAPNMPLLMFADRQLQLPLDAGEHAAILSTFENLLDKLGPSRVTLAQELLSDASMASPSRLLLLRLCVRKLEKADFDEDLNLPATKSLHRMLILSSTSQQFVFTQRSLLCVMDMLKTKSFMANQYNIDLTLQTLHHLAQRPGSGKSILYLDIYSTLTALLLNHRSRLQGRFHILIKLLQTLLAHLFQPLSGWDPLIATHPPTPKHAAAFARLLKLFCEPPQSRKPTHPDQPLALTDESRKEQAHVGTFVQHVLHTYCNRILHGTLGEGMREALTPGVRAMVEAMEIGGREGGKALSAAMGNAERAVLRGVYEEWRRFGKWRGG